MSDCSSPRDVSTYWNRWARVWNPFLRAVGYDRRYRAEGISMLGLGKGMTVLDIACGTGFNFPFLMEAIGPGGHIVALDISSAMLQRARTYALESGWQNIEFVLGDAAEIRLPEADAAAAFWCMVSIPRYRQALRNIVSSLGTGGRLAVLDFKPMDDFPGLLLNPLVKWIVRVTHQDIVRQPWLEMENLLTDVKMREWKYGGLLLSSVYLAWGRRGEPV